MKSPTPFNTVPRFVRLAPAMVIVALFAVAGGMFWESYTKWKKNGEFLADLKSQSEKLKASAGTAKHAVHPALGKALPSSTVPLSIKFKENPYGAAQVLWDLLPERGPQASINGLFKFADTFWMTASESLEVGIMSTPKGLELQHRHYQFPNGETVFFAVCTEKEGIIRGGFQNLTTNSTGLDIAKATEQIAADLDRLQLVMLYDAEKKAEKVLVPVGKK